VATTTVPAPEAPRIRGDIQALRALAVLLVVAYHFWPEGPVRGGYVGVDVFFVISGFLITSHLVRSMEAGTFSFRAFWSRRARRLLPVAIVVIGVVVVATPVLAPQTMWRETALQAVASSLYVQNIALTLSSVDYLAEDGVATPLQHYWSLSLEEQFYILWPILLVGAVVLGRRAGRPRKAVVVAIVVVAAISFVASIGLTGVFPGAAYFVPVTRAWEFAVGAAVFLLTSRYGLHRRLRLVLLASGTVLVIVPAFVYDAQTSFPGAAALVPVLGAGAMIAAAYNQGAVGAILNARPLRAIGDASYSLYLWHWPIAVFAFIAIRSADAALPQPLVAAILFGIAIPVSILSKKYVEDAAMPGGSLSRLRVAPKALVVLPGATVVVVLAASSLLYADHGLRAELSAERAAALAADDGCLGAGVELRDDCGPQPLVAPAVLAEDDLPPVYSEGCQAGPREERLISCSWGRPSPVRVALVGDSHAASWFPALERAAAEQGWQLVTFLKSSCRWSTYQDSGGPIEHASCVSWNDQLSRELVTGDFDAIVTGYYSRPLAVQDLEAVATGFAEAWAPVPDDTHIIAMVDTPQISDESVLCLFGSLADPASCESEPVGLNTSTDVLRRAVASTPSSTVVDLSSAFLDDGDARTVAGGLVVWRDAHHFTASFSRTLSPVLESAISEATG